MDSHQERSFFKRGPETLHLCRLAVWLAWRAQPLLAGLMLMLIALQSALPPLLLWFTQALVERLTLDMTLEIGGPDRLLIASSIDDGDIYAFVLCRLEDGECSLSRFILLSLSGSLSGG